LVGLIDASTRLADCKKSLPLHEAAIGEPENPWRFWVLPKWTFVRSHSQARAMVFNAQVAEQSNEHQTTLRLVASFDGAAAPVPVRNSPCFEARSAS
jgi:hypothetical protein